MAGRKTFQLTEVSLTLWFLTLAPFPPPVASGTVAVCKNNTTVLGRSGRAGAWQKKEQGKHIRILGDHDFTMARSTNAHMH